MPKPYCNSIRLFLSLGLLVTFAGCQQLEREAQPVEAPPAPLVEVQRAQQSDQVLKRSFTGFLHPKDAHGVGFMIAGRVKSIEVKEGDIVAAGQRLAQLTPEDYALTKELADIQRTALKPNVERVERLVEQQVLPRSELDKIQGQYDAAVTQWKRARRQLNYATLDAPIDGVVHELRTAVGQVIAAGSPVAVILDIDSLKAKFGVTQSELSGFTIGQRYQVFFPGLDEQREGVVSHIDYVSDPKTRTFMVSIEIDNQSQSLRPSMLARIEREMARYSGVFVPLYAIEQSAAGPIISVVDEDKTVIEEREVVLGQSIGELVQIKEGLTEGELYLVVGQEFVKEGQEVRIKMRGEAETMGLDEQPEANPAALGAPGDDAASDRPAGADGLAPNKPAEAAQAPLLETKKDTQANPQQDGSSQDEGRE